MFVFGFYFAFVFSVYKADRPSEKNSLFSDGLLLIIIILRIIIISI